MVNMQRIPHQKRQRTPRILARVLSRRVGPVAKALIAWWAALAIAAAVSAVAGVPPWLPVEVHTYLLVGGAVLTVAYLLSRDRASIRAAFLDGMLYEREHGHDIELPLASGDDTGGGKVMSFQRAAGHRKPAPRPRPRS